MKKIIFNLLSFLVLISLSVVAEDINQISIEDATPESTILNFSLNDYEFKTIQTAKGELVTVHLPDGTPMLVEGAPDMEKITSALIIPDEVRMGLEIVSSDFIELQNIDVASSKGNLTRNIDPLTIPYTYSTVYDKNSFYPGEIVKLRDPHILRDYRGQVVVFYPFQYNPVTKVLRVYTSISVKVNVKDYQGVNKFERTSNLTSINYEFDQIYSHKYINYPIYKSLYPQVEEDGNMLIISHSSFIDAMAPFVQWKLQRGIDVELVDIANIGNNQNSIDVYVENYYQNADKLTFLLLVGDHQYVNSYNSSSGYSDNYYSYISGNDSYSEFFVGRFSAETESEVETMVERLIRYEKYPDINATWYKDGVGVASSEGPGDDNEYDYEHIRNIRTDLLNYNYANVFELYDGSQGGQDAAGNPSSSDLFNIFENGVSVFNYTGHGSNNSCSTTGLSSGDVDNLTNVDMYPLIWAVACVNGNFTNGDCFAEAWIRATHNSTGEPTGAIATLMSTINQSWSPPMSGQDEMNDILVESYTNNIKRSFGGLSMNGCMQMNDDYGSQGDEMTDTWTCFGDPSVMVRTDIPFTLTTTHNSIIPLGTASLQVASPTEGAMIALTMNGELIGKDIISNGVANIVFDPINIVDTITVTATAYNAVPYESTVLVISPNGPYIITTNYSIDDSQGNNNGVVDYDEDILLNLSLQNIGTSISNNLDVVISTTSPNVTIIDGFHSFGNLSSNSSVSGNGVFSFKVHDNVLDQQSLFFNVDLTDLNGNIWQSSISLIVYAPVLEVLGIVVDDYALGNGNGVLEDGESATINIEVKNIGSSTSPLCDAIVDIVNPYLTVISATNTNLGLIAPNSIEIAMYNVSMSNNIPSGTTIDVDFNAIAGAYTANNVFVLTTNLLMEDFESNNFNAFPWFMEQTPWYITTEDSYEGAYCSKSGMIGDNASSVLSITVEVLTDDYISFFKKVSSEDSYDFLKFYIDNTLVDQWSGEVDWSQEVYFVSSGFHTFKWSYDKDYMIASYDDAAWLDNIVLPPSVIPQQVTISGQVIEDGGAGVQFSDVSIGNNTITTNIFGEFSTTLVEGNYDIVAGKWGYKTKCESVTVDANNPIVIELEEGYYDDFTFDYGWNIGGDASDGFWERAIPAGTEYLSQTANPDADVNNDCGEYAFVTGNDASSQYSDDVDDGTVTLTSPIFDLTNYTDPYIKYNKWLFTSGSDKLTVVLNNGSDEELIEEYTFSSSNWNQSNIRILNHINLSNSMSVQFSTTELIDGNLLESAIDGFEIYDNAVNLNEEVNSEILIYPNPANKEFTLDFNSSFSQGLVQVYNSIGILIKELSLISNESIKLGNNLPSGVYFIKSTIDNKTFVNTVILK